MMRLRLILLTLLMLIARPLIADQESTTLEYGVKAVCLVNFAKYVQWPEIVFESEKQPIRVCILGESPFGDVFQSAEAPKEAQGRPLEVVQLPATAKKEDFKGCRILYWQERSDALIKPLMSVLEEHRILTVSDKAFKGALISFMLQGGKVRFKVDRKTAEALGLTISSQLLRLAIVDD